LRQSVLVLRIRIIDKTRRALETGQGQFMDGRTGRIVIELVNRHRFAARHGDQRSDFLFVDQADRFALRQRSLAFGIGKFDHESCFAAAMRQRGIHLLLRQLNRRTIERRSARPAQIDQSANADFCAKSAHWQSRHRQPAQPTQRMFGEMHGILLFADESRFDERQQTSYLSQKERQTKGSVI